MDPALAQTGVPAPYSFTDGLGVRRRIAEPTRHEPVELLCLRGDLTSVPSFEFALRERVSHLSAFHHGCYAPVRSVERLKSPPSALVLVSDVTPGVRLSEILAFADRTDLQLDIDAALCLLRQIVPAVAMLHEHAPDVAHGAIAPERIVVTPNARIVMVEHVLGAALTELQYSREQYWQELRVAVPGTAGPVSFNHRSDVTQVGVVALSLILGRTLGDNESPSQLGDVVASSWAISARGGLEPLPAGLRAWLMRALQLDARESFESASDAQEELERVLGDSDYLAAPATLEAFLARYHEAADAADASAQPASAPAMPMAASPLPYKSPVTIPVAPPVKAVEPAPEPMRQAVIIPAQSAPVLTVPTPQKSPAATPVPQVVAPAAASVVLTPAASHPTAAPSEVRRHSERDDHDDFGFSDLRHTDHVDAAAHVAAPRGLFRKPWFLAAAAATVAIAAIGVPAVRHFVMPGAAVHDGTLVVNTNPPGAKLFVDGVERGATPLTVALNPGTHSLEVRGDGAPRLMPITIAAGAQMSQYLELAKVASVTGQLMVRSEPAGARVSVDGIPRGTAPVTVSDLAPGDHAVVLESDLGAVKQSVSVEAGLTASLVVPLVAPEGAPVSGWIAVSAPADVQVFEGARLLGSSQSDRLMVSAGRHELQIVSETLGYRASRTVQVSPGKVTPVRVDFPKGAIALNAVPWAEVWVDGEKVGETPIGNLQLTIGPHDVLFRHPDLGEQRHKATVTATAPARLSVDMRKK